MYISHPFLPYMVKTVKESGTGMSLKSKKYYLVSLERKQMLAWHSADTCTMGNFNNIYCRPVAVLCQFKAFFL